MEIKDIKEASAKELAEAKCYFAEVKEELKSWSDKYPSLREKIDLVVSRLQTRIDEVQAEYDRLLLSEMGEV